MKWFGKNKQDSTAIPADLQPYYSGKKSGLRSWLGPIARGLLLLAVLVLLVGGGVWLVHKVTGSSDKTKVASSNAQSALSKAKQKAVAPSATARTPAAPSTQVAPSTPATPPVPAAPAPTASIPQAAAPSAPTTPGASQLVNTGPGEMTGVFIAALLAGGYSYRARLLRKLQAKV